MLSSLFICLTEIQQQIQESDFTIIKKIKVTGFSFKEMHYIFNHILQIWVRQILTATLWESKDLPEKKEK